MALKDPFAQMCLERLQVLGTVTARAMFGGYGFYCDGLFFAGIMEEGRLFIKTDKETAGIFEEAGARQWIWDGDPRKGPTAMAYWSPEGDWLDDPAEIVKWGKLGVEAATRAAAKKGGKKS